MFNAGPVDISWAVQNSQVRGILAAFYPGQVYCLNKDKS